MADAAKSSLKSTTLFGFLRRLFYIFAKSGKRWNILCDHIEFTLKRLSDTRWEAKTSSVGAVRYQVGDVHDALVTLAEVERSNYPEVADEALGLCKQLKDFSFLLSLVVCHDVLFQVNIVSKSMQSEKMDIIP